MVRIGYFLASEAFPPGELVRQAKLAEQAGFDRLWISDHFHPWLEEQGESPFVWSVIGALSEATSLPISTAVTCPLIRTHPAVIAHASATAALQCDGGFTLGLGTGEALNEHVTGQRWPTAPERLDMLEEAISVIRALHTGDEVNHWGDHYTVDHARLYSVPDPPPPITVSAFGPRAARLAAGVADGFATMFPGSELVRDYREAGGRGVVQGGMKVCWADSEETGASTARRLWPNELLPGALPLTLPTPVDMAAATGLITEEMAREQFVCGSDAQQHIDRVDQYIEAGFDEVYVQQMGDEQDRFFDAWASHVLPFIGGEKR